MSKWDRLIERNWNRGERAFKGGKDLSSNPYLTPCRGRSRMGDLIHRLRRQSWDYGWRLAAGWKPAKEESC
jgi:hypothetical protein